jgi:hypothetical protein
MTKKPVEPNYPSLVSLLAELIEAGRKVAVRHVNTALTGTYWCMKRPAP